MKEEFFSKFIDYNKKLEEILEEKDFSEKVKNLLLSMLYKIETSYKDYEAVKVNVPTKAEFIEHILEIIQECKKIEIVKPTSEEGRQLEKDGIRYKVDELAYTIVTYENEKDILEAIINLNSINIYLPEKYNLIRVAFPQMLNEGSRQSDVEIIRDFNAWSWNIIEDEMSNIYYNIIYQNFLILLGYETIEEIFSKEDTEDVIEIIEKELANMYGSKRIKEFMDLIYKISIETCVNKNKVEKSRLLDEKKFILKEYEEINNKKEYLNNITKIKKNNHIEIGKIDTILSSKELLLKEYLKRNEKLPKYNQLFSITHLQEILNKQRKKLLAEIESCNKKLEPQNYIEYREKLEAQLNFLVNVEEDKISKDIIEEKVINLQKIFMELFTKKIDKAKEKEEYIELVYLLRYYKFLPVGKQAIKDKQELSELIKNMEEKLLIKLWELKAINKLIPKDELNIIILRNVFDTKIINLSNIQIKVIKLENKIRVELYDTEVLEKTVEIDKKEDERINIRLNRNIKIFN